jgi:hypothetical protein
VPDKETATDDILDLLTAGWNAVGAVTKDKELQVPNLHYEKPNAQTGTKKDVDLYGKVTINHTLGQQDALIGDAGVRTIRQFGIVTVEIYAPEGEGTTLSDQACTVIRDTLLGVRSQNGVVFRAPSYNEVGNFGPWYQTNVTIPFEYDETVP